MPQPAPHIDPGVCPRCYRTVTARMPRVLTTEGTYHHRCYMGVRQPRRPNTRARAHPAQPDGNARSASDRLPRILERLAQAVVIVILIGTALILLAHTLP